MEKKRSVGVTIGSILTIILVLFIWFYIGTGIGETSHFMWSPFLIPLAIFLGVIVPLVYLIASVGILFLKSWARKLVLFMAVGSAIIVTYIARYKYICRPVTPAEAASIRASDYLLASFVWVFTLIILYFFTRPKVKEQFK